jgi:hypothetical protein
MTIHTVKQAVSYQDLLERLVKRTIILKRDVHSFPVLMTMLYQNVFINMIFKSPFNYCYFAI